MTFPENVKRGRKKGLMGNQVLVRRYSSDKYNTTHILKNKIRKKVDKGQCRITIPRAIADSMELRDGDIIEFADHTKTSKIMRKVYPDDLED